MFKKAYKLIFFLIAVPLSVFPQSAIHSAKNTVQNTWNSVFLQPKGTGWTMPTVNVGGRDFKLDDYSYTGYKLSQVGLGDAIPCKHVTITDSGDITTALRAAVSTMAGLGGGTIHIPAGTFMVSGTVTITSGNIRIAGAGSGATTILVASSYNPGNQLTEAPFTFMGGGGVGYSQWAEPGKSPLATTLADVNRGDQIVKVVSSAGFAVGDWVVIQQYFWPDFVKANSAGTWTTNPPETGTDSAFSNTFCYPRKITAINGKVITLDAPIPQTLRNNDSTVWFYQPNSGQFIENVGIDGLTLQVQDNHNGPDGIPIGTALAFKGVFNGWARDIKIHNIAKNGIKPAWSTRITVMDCEISGAQNTGGGGWGYGFYTYASSQVLYKRCTAVNLRHNFSTEYAMTNMVVYTRCDSIKTMGNSAGVTMECDDTHFGYSQRLLWDMFHQENTGLLTENRGTYSHGAYETFGGGVVWNYSGTSSNPYRNWQAGTVQCSPATYTSDSDALVIGTSGATIYDNSQDPASGYVYGTIMTGDGPKLGPRGNVAYEGINRTGLFPSSLFDAQLRTRLGFLPPDNAPVSCEQTSAFTPNLEK
jgi:hypothetical protein